MGAIFYEILSNLLFKLLLVISVKTINKNKAKSKITNIVKAIVNNFM